MRVGLLHRKVTSQVASVTGRNFSPLYNEDIDRSRALSRLSELIRTLKPMDRQIMISYLEEMDAAAIADITGLSASNVAMKIHRIKNILSRRFLEEQRHAG